MPAPKTKDFDALSHGSTSFVKKWCASLYSVLVVDRDCSVDVKSDYASFSIENGLVAVVYPFKDEVDLILSLPRNPKDKYLFDAVDKDYKWRTLPVGICVTSVAVGKVALERAQTAYSLVADGVIQDQEGGTFARPKAAFQPAFKKKLRFR